MQVVLLERVEKLGQMGEIVSVRDGYARNYLLPQQKALRATKANLALFEAQRAQLEQRNAERRAEAEREAATLDGKQFVLIRAASEAGALYGSVTARDISEAAAQEGFTIGRGQIVLDRPVKELGLYPLKVSLHPEVPVTITVNIARSQEEAEIQATGKTIQQLRAEEEAAAEFDIQELFDDIGGAAGEDDGGGGDGPIVDEDSQAGEQPRY